MLSEQATNRALKILNKHGVETVGKDGKFKPVVQEFGCEIFQAWNVGVDHGKACKEDEIKRTLGL